MTFKWGLTLFLYSVISFKYIDKMAKYKPMANEEFEDDDPEVGDPQVKPDNDEPIQAPPTEGKT